MNDELTYSAQRFAVAVAHVLGMSHGDKRLLDVLELAARMYLRGERDAHTAAGYIVARIGAEPVAA